MKRVPDASTRDPSQLYITLRKDLQITVQYYRGKPCYLIEDPQEIQFFRVGIPEGTFLSMLDGKNSLDEVLRQSAYLGKDAFSEEEAMQIVHWLLDSKLAHPSGTISLDEREDDNAPPRRGGFNPLAIRIPLLHPDHFFSEVLPWFAWFFESAVWGVWVCLCLAVVWHLTSSWAVLTKELQSVVAPRHWPSLMIAWAFLKVLHEFAHGMVCKKYGGIVSEMGLMILWGVPVPYVDVTSAWSFRSKRQRIFTALAGIYVESFVAALAALFWSISGPGWLHYWCVHIVFIAGISSIMFNGNPLMRFDGYYVLMDLLEIPNLYGSGQQFWNGVRGKILSGIPLVLPGDTPWQRQIIAIYGILAAIWRIVIYLSLTILTLAIFPIDESHFIWAILAMVVGIAVWRLRKNNKSPSPREKPSQLRHAAIGGAGFLALAVLLLCLATPFRITAPAIVEYKPLHLIRNYSPGFVEKIEVHSGQAVNAGQIIAVLVNDELEYELADLKRKIAISELNLRTFQHKDDLAELKAEEQKLDALEKRRTEKIEQLARLVVRAPAAGIIISRQPESLVGKYLSKGSEVVLLGNEQFKEIRLSVDENDADAFFAQVGLPVWIRAGGCVLSNPLSEIEPRANLEPLHPALAATKGGPLPVQHKAKDAQEKKDESGEDSYELLDPQFTGDVILSPDQSLLLATGQRVQVSFSPQGQSFGDYLFTRFQRWCRDKVRRVRSAWNS
jgi:putative peptide zinc metalloprotease protein